MVLTDNRNARDWGNESMITDGNRHIDRRYMLIREKVKLGHIAIVWMSGDWNISDTGTKRTFSKRHIPPIVHIELYRPSMAFPHTTVWGMYGGN